MPAPVLNNIGVLEYHKADFAGAQERFEAALGEVGQAVELAGGILSDELDAVLTAVTYNLGVVYEAIGEPDKAKDAFGQILSRHPEYVDGPSQPPLGRGHADPLSLHSQGPPRAHRDEGQGF